LKNSWKYLDKRNECIATLSIRPRRNFSAESFTRLVGEADRLEVFLRFLKFCDENVKRSKALKPIRKIRKSADKVLLVYQKATLKNQIFISSGDLTVKRSGKKEIENARQEFFKIDFEATAKEQSARFLDLDRSLRKTTREDLARFQKRRHKRLIQLILKPLKKKNWHQKAEEIMGDLKILQEIDTRVAYPYLPVLEAFHDLLLQWNGLLKHTALAVEMTKSRQMQDSDLGLVASWMVDAAQKKEDIKNKILAEVEILKKSLPSRFTPAKKIHKESKVPVA